MLTSRPSRNRGFIANLFNFGAKPTDDGPPPVKPDTLLRLEELRRSHTFVDVNFVNRDGRSYQSLIINVDVEDNSLLIDELYPLDGDMQNLLGEVIEISPCGKGMPMKFTSTISRIEMYDDSPAYRIELPRTITANQRRKFFRVPVTSAIGIYMRVPINNMAVMAEVKNISASGVGLCIDKNVTEYLRANHLLRGVKLLLPDNEVVNCDLEVRSYEYRKKPHRNTIVGARFIDMNPKAQNQMERLMQKLQREARREESKRAP